MERNNRSPMSWRPAGEQLKLLRSIDTLILLML